MHAINDNYYGYLKNNNRKMDTWNSHKWLWNPFHTPHFLQCSHPLCEMVSSIFSNEKKRGSRRLSAMLKRGKNIYHSALSACWLMLGIMLDTCLTLSLLIFKTLWWDGASVIPIVQPKKEINVEDKWVSWELKPLLVPCLMLVLLATFPSLENCALSTDKWPCLWRVSATQHLLSQHGEGPAQGWHPDTSCQVTHGLPHSLPKCTPSKI